MPLRDLQNTDLQYHLISYDRKGDERTDDPDGLMSENLLGVLAQGAVTDVFVFSHGWLTDYRGAINSYDKWIQAMLLCEDDLRAIRERRPKFNPLLVGLHWRSCPFGSEDLNADVRSFSTSGEDPLAGLLDEAAEGIAETPEARAALGVILASAVEDMAPETMPPEVVDAYQVLWDESGLGLEGPAGAPGEEAEHFDPEGLYEATLDDEVSFGGGLIGGLLSPLRPLSFWKMKQRARSFGEGAAGDLLRHIQRQTEPHVRIHLMGHSFGCIVVSAMVAGAGGNTPLPRPVDSMLLAQAAVSCWSYTPKIPIAKGKPGYFGQIPLQGKVAGPLVTTQSVHDSAVGKAYPLAVSRRSVSFAPPGALGPPPPDGSMGTFGIQGPGIDVVDRPMLAIEGTYDFKPGTIYNLEGSEFICGGSLLAGGAHSEIDKPEVAHAFWSAAMTDGR